MDKLLLMIIITGSLTSAALCRDISRIVGGEDAPSEFGHFHASLQNLQGLHVCGGAIISKWHIVTAAHCVYETKPEYIKVKVGTIDLSKDGMMHNVESIAIYCGFNYTAKTDDVALIRVDEPFDLKYVSIIGMDDQRLYERDIVLLSGFGAHTAIEGSKIPMQLLTTSVFCQKTCRHAMRNIRKVTDGMFCTFSQKGEGTCKGDSGSPIIRGTAMVGLVSWGIPCAVGFPDVHTRIEPYLEWLKSEIHKDICDIKYNRTSTVSVFLKTRYVSTKYQIN